MPAELEHFYLRRIVRENHGGAVLRVVSHPTSPLLSPPNRQNLLATLSSTQCNIYDSEHCGPHTDLVSQFVSPNGVEFTSVAWVRAMGEVTDAMIGVGDGEGLIRILSLTRSAEVRRLASGGGSGPVREMYGVGDAGWLVALHGDGVRVWDVDGGGCLVHIDMEDAMCISGLGGRGDVLWVGRRGGDVLGYRVVQKGGGWRAVEVEGGRITLSVGAITWVHVPGDGTLVAQGATGKVSHVSLSHHEVIRTFAGPRGQARPAMTGAGDRILIGDEQGGAHVYALATGKLERTLKHRRATRPILAATFMRDGGCAFVVGEDGCLWGWEEVGEEERGKWAAWRTEVEKGA